MAKNTNQIYLVVPKLIEQSTWGGDYILKSKNWDKKKDFKNIKIGQSYELFSGTKLRGDISSSLDSSFTGELGYAMETEKIIYKSNKKNLIPIQKLIDKDPKAFLGPVALKKHGAKIKILIKYTQAKGNSFQIHVRKDNKKWKAKPESWYFLEPGYITLGAKNDVNWRKFESACLDLDQEMKALSKCVINKKITLQDAKKQASITVKKYNPWKYVNILKTKKDQLIDLSCGALHHSWEENDKMPLGNIVYELCYDVMDPVSVLRSFDKGKLQSDGKLRKLDIKDYFKYVDKGKAVNNPAKHQVRPKQLLNDKNAKIELLLRTKNYSMDRIMLKGSYSGKYTDTKNSFHHLFIRSGRVIINSAGGKVILTEGHSCVIPASIGKYEIVPQTKTSEIFKTFVE